MTQQTLFECAPIVGIGSDIRVKIGVGNNELSEPKVRRIAYRLSIKNPQRDKTFRQLCSTMKALGIEEWQAARKAAKEVAECGVNTDDFGATIRQAKLLVFGRDDYGLGTQRERTLLKRAAGIAMRLAHEPEKICAVHREGDYLVIPRGSLPWISSELKGAVYEDQRVHGAPYAYTWRGHEPRQYQNEAIGFQHHRDGIVVMPCGSGKTLTGLAGIARVGRRAVVLVPNRDIRDEWITECWDCLGLAAGQVGEGIFKPEPHVTIAINASAIRLKGAKFDQVFGSTGILVIDESHHSAAPKLRALIERVPAALRWGFTATPDREDGLGPVVQWVIGPIIYEATQQELVAQGYLMVPEVVRVESPWECPTSIDPSINWPAMVDALIRDEIRNEFVIETALQCIERHNRTLVLTVRKEHSWFLAKSLVERGVNAVSIDSDTPRSKRKHLMNEFRNGDISTVCAINIADEGLNVPALDGGLVAGPVKAKSKTIQRLGRLMRPSEGKQPELYDITDPRVPHLQRQWYARQKAYKTVLGDVKIRKGEKPCQIKTM